MTHVLGPGLHYTYLGVASAYCCLRQCLRMILAGRLKPADWALLWARRSFPFAGPTAQFCKALGSLNIHWISATRISASGRTLSFDPGDELVTRASIGAVKNLMGSKKIQSILHEARAFFRYAVVHQEYIRRPKDFGGLDVGLSEDYAARKSMYAMQLHSGGPALSTGGLWTHLAVSRLPFCQQTDQCPRCGMVETTMHRLWDCRHNFDLRQNLDRMCPGNHFPSGLPDCLARCGRILANIVTRYGVALFQAYHIQEYLLAVNAIAIQNFADARAGKDLRFIITECKQLPADAIFGVALPPLKRSRPGQDTLLRGLAGGAAFGAGRPSLSLPAQPAAADFTPTEPMVLSCDGSARSDSSGWGFTVAGAALSLVNDFCGLIILVHTAGVFIGATTHTNNVGELSAMLFALSWIHCSDFAGPFVLEYDSEYAAGSIRRLLWTRSNLTLVINARAIYDQVADKVVWRKVRAHSGFFFNERADRLANCGASGIYCGYTDVVRWVGYIA